MAAIVDAAAQPAAVGDTSLEQRDLSAALKLREQAHRYRQLAQSLFTRNAVEAAEECARALDAEAARLEGSDVTTRG
jgi:hypothetical protein